MQANGSIERLDNWHSTPELCRFKPAFDFLKQVSSARQPLPTGKVPIIGEDIFAIVSEYRTKPVENLFFEAHRRYIDIQYIFSGQEIIGFIPGVEGLNVEQAYNPDSDVELYSLPQRLKFVPMRVQSGDFVLFYPGQAHMPGAVWNGVHSISKIVVKVDDTWGK